MWACIVEGMCGSTCYLHVHMVSYQPAETQHAVYLVGTDIRAILLPVSEHKFKEVCPRPCGEVMYPSC